MRNSNIFLNRCFCDLHLHVKLNAFIDDTFINLVSASVFNELYAVYAIRTFCILFHSWSEIMYCYTGMKRKSKRTGFPIEIQALWLMSGFKLSISCKTILDFTMIGVLLITVNIVLYTLLRTSLITWLFSPLEKLN